MIYPVCTLFLLVFPAILSANPDPKQLYTLNCSACHQLKVAQAGPALTEIAQLYRGKPNAFIKWAQNPTPHQRKNFAPMPAMTHVPVADLKKIYQHIMAITKGVKPVAPQKTIDHFPEKLNRRPLVQRIFVQDSGPASIAVALDDRYSFVFDAGATRFRYLWTGGFLDGFPYWQGNGDGLAHQIGTTILTETHSPIPFITAQTPGKFLGYHMKDGLPTFRYRAKNVTIHERITPTAEGIHRSFSFQNAPSEITLTFPQVAGLTYGSSHGNWRGTQLTTGTKEPVVIHYTFSK